MKFKRLKLSGFKSFVEPTEMRIEKGLTGVVGPNGCGKSNLLEAIRWAMGEGSPKSLRGSGMEDVIFAGTETRPQRDFAEVSLLVERSQQEAGENQAGETEVTRRIERGAGSAYRLNGRDVRAKDVALLFADAATGAHSPALVSQGRIGAVIAAKPQQRRQLLEEAAGISGLHQRRKDAEAKLRAAEANLERLDHLLGEQAARAASLKRQAKAAERYRILSDRIRLAEAQLVLAQWQEADKAAQAAETDAKNAEARAKSLAGERDAAEKARGEAAQALTEAREAAARAREQGQEIGHRLASLRAEQQTLARRIADLDAAAGALAAEQAREAALRQDADSAIKALEEEQKRLEATLSSDEEEAAKLRGRLGDVERAASEAEAALASLVAREAAAKAERTVAEAALEAAQAQCARTENEMRRLAEQEAALDAGDDYRAALEAAEKAAGVAKKRVADAEKAIAEAEAKGAAAGDKRDAAEAARAEAQAALATVEAEHRVLASALEKGETGLIAGIRAAPGYERALAAALGEDLHAEIGGEGARRWAEGSADESGDPELPEGAEPLSDHVEAPPALHRRLSMIGVVEEDRGQALAAGQRLVTRDGIMRRWDGFTVSGEGAAEAERLERVNRAEALAAKLPGLRAAAEEAQAARDAVEKAIGQAREAEREARSRLARAEEARREAARDIDRAKGAIERQDERKAALAERREELKPLAKSAEERLHEAQRALAALPDHVGLSGEVAAAREKASEAGRAVADQRAAVATRQQGIEAARERQGQAAREAASWRARARDAEERLQGNAERAKAQGLEREELAGKPQEVAEKIARLEEEQRGRAAANADVLEAEREAQAALRQAEGTLAAAAESHSNAREIRAAAQARAEAAAERRRDRARASGEAYGCPPILLAEKFGFDDAALPKASALKEEVAGLTAQRERIGPVNLVAEEELKQLEDEQQGSAAEREELGEAISRLRGSIGHLNREGRVRLLAAFEAVDAHFQSLFTTLFGGGKAHLELVESDDPLEAGLEIMAQPPGKKLAALTLLSGGEQALTAVALIFALFLTNPAPICVLDEVDAPLDDANVERFCDLLERMNAETETRYLIVTHNAVTMSRMDRLYGVTMVERGVSRLVSVDLEAAEELIAAE
ncbi:chromosome segregation protein SMC [Sphingomicrobium aestuariivivum]|uniref:chromosome segregation protein SMC n=1 Tax=Sphingomicrobium aestuariivivum TaxID=1582356 RepID=UPI001FD7183F|nr:chromosome segregation protein SMC [Sphingomicrobium aestuariivivum]MCJ8190810.1 chromosome segregation protein SMC [Sphingomicrobium aestuariivivum]